MKRLYGIFKGSGWLNVLGMSVAFAAFYIVMSQVWYDLTFNRRIKDAEDIYVVSMPSLYNSGEQMILMNRQYVPMTAAKTPDIQSFGASSLFIGGATATNLHIMKDGERIWTPVYRLLQCDEGFLRTFGVDFTCGAIEDLDQPSVVSISESVAAKYGLSVGDAFVDDDPDSEDRLTVKAIFADFPQNCILSGIEGFQVYEFEKMPVDPTEWSFPYFVKLQKGSDPSVAAETMSRVYEEETSREVSGLDLVPLTDMYFSETLEDRGLESGNRTTTLTLLVVAILILAITLINALNFFMAEVPVKIKEVNTRKVFGSSRMSIIRSFVAESFILSVVSFVISIAMINLFKGSGYASILSCGLDFSQNPAVFMITCGAVVAMGLTVNFFPAFYITSFTPAMIVKGAFGTSGAGRRLRSSLIVLQFIITIALLSGTVFMKMQYRYMMGYDMGFDKENLLTVRLPGNFSGNYLGVKDKLLQNPRIKDVTFANGSMVAVSRMGWSHPYRSGETISYMCYPVYPDFLRFMGIEVVEGRDFTDSDLKGDGVLIFTETAKSKYGLDMGSASDIANNVGVGLIGFCKDFNSKPLQYGYEPFAFMVIPSRHCNNAYIRTVPEADAGDVAEYVRKSVSGMCANVPESTIDVKTFDDELSVHYKSEDDFNTIINIFTALAMVISLLGVFGLVRIDTAYRKKEIGIRRVLGESVRDILLLFNKSILKLLLVSAVVAIPLTCLVMDYYLSSFAYRIPLYWWVFALSFIAVEAVTAAVVCIGCYNAATANPVESIKNE